MKKLKILLLAALTLFMFSCNKTLPDLQANKLTEQEIIKQYTTVPTGLNPILQRIADKLKIENEEKHFLTKWGNRAGTPLWSKAQFKKKNNSAVARNSNETDIIFIPLSMPNTQTVNGFLACEVSALDINFAEFDKYNYENFGFGKTNGEIDAEAIAAKSMELEFEAFGHSKFKMLDYRLFIPIGFNKNLTKATELLFSEEENINTNVLRRKIRIYMNHCTEHDGIGPGGHEGFGCDECSNCVSYFTLFIDDNWENMNSGGNGSGGSGAGGSEPIDSIGKNDGWVYDPGLDDFPNKNVRDSLDGYPCAQAVLARMKDLNTSSKNILRDVFNVNQNVNLTFLPKPSNLLSKPTATGEYKYGYIDANGVFNGTVHLNQDQINNSSKELIAIVVYHESIHAFLHYLVDKMVAGQTTFAQIKIDYPKIWEYMNSGWMFDQHQYMATELIDNYRNILKTGFPNIPDSTASALSWGGLFQTPAFDTTFNSNLRDRIKNICLTARDSSSQKMKTMGLTKCN